jgi:menaquinone-9 beta-reductase
MKTRAAGIPIEIVGGGLAGLSLGLALCREGVPVTVFEAEDYPRHRVCGEFISGLDDSTVARLGLHEFLSDARPHRGVTYHLRGRALRPLRLPATAWGISRHALDARLARAFADAGGSLRTHTRIAEGADSPGRVIAAGRRRRGPFWVGLKVHVRNLILANDFEIHLGDRGYIGLSRLESGSVNACGLFAGRNIPGRGADLLYAYLEAAGLQVLSGRLRAAEVDPGSFCVSAAPLGDRRVAPFDGVRIGDACATIPAFTGNGLAMALQGAEISVGPLRDYSEGRTNWEQASRAVAAAQRRRFRRRLLFAAVLQPFFLEPRRQRLLAFLVGCRLMPFHALYSALR